MSNIEITIHCPELALLAEAINHRTAAPAAAEKPMPVQAPAPMNTTPAPAQMAAPAYPAVPPAPVQTATAPAPTYTPAIPTAAPMAPTAPAPTYTIDQITKAGAELVQAGKMGELMALLQRFGVQTVTQVPQERLGELANALRGLGAKL